jgi:adenosine/AMP kinase
LYTKPQPHGTTSRSGEEATMNVFTLRIQKPDDVNLILGQSHFIKTVEDLHEALVGAVPGIRFGVAFCESSGPCLVRHSGTDPELTALAKQQAYAIGAGHSFLILLRGVFPINVLNAVKMVPEVCRIYCATANAVEVVIAETDQGRGILGIVDGSRSQGIEDDAQIADRKALLRTFGYKL